MGTWKNNIITYDVSWVEQYFYYFFDLFNYIYISNYIIFFSS